MKSAERERASDIETHREIELVSCRPQISCSRLTASHQHLHHQNQTCGVLRVSRCFSLVFTSDPTSFWPDWEASQRHRSATHQRSESVTGSHPELSHRGLMDRRLFQSDWRRLMWNSESVLVQTQQNHSGADPALSSAGEAAAPTTSPPAPVRPSPADLFLHHQFYCAEMSRAGRVMRHHGSRPGTNPEQTRLPSDPFWTQGCAGNPRERERFIKSVFNSQATESL